MLHAALKEKPLVASVFFPRSFFFAILREMVQVKAKAKAKAKEIDPDKDEKLAKAMTSRRKNLPTSANLLPLMEKSG